MVSDVSGGSRDKRGFEKQKPRRELEAEVRNRVVRAAERLKQEGHFHGDAAYYVGISKRCLDDWLRKSRKDGLEPKPRGRPVQSIDDELRRRIIRGIDYLGPFVGLETLKFYYPKIPRAELEIILRKYRRDHISGLGLIAHILKWTRAGAVWAMDFYESPQLIDGIFRYVLSVRDLGSGKNLLWLPLEHADGPSVRAALLHLFLAFGPPLVIKEDNDRAFKFDEVVRLFRYWGVVFLRSPIHSPWYNGACEAGIGTLKTYTHHEAARYDRPGLWTCDDLEAARRRANELSRPFGTNGASPNGAWTDRDPISVHERIDFLQSYRHSYHTERCQRQHRKKTELNNNELADLQRWAIGCTLVGFGLLEHRRKRIRPPFKMRFLRKFM